MTTAIWLYALVTMFFLGMEDGAALFLQVEADDADGEYDQDWMDLQW